MIGENIKNVAGYIAAMERKQQMIRGSVAEARDNTTPKTQAALDNEFQSLKFARNAKDARNTIERIKRRSDTQDHAILDDIFNDTFFSEWSK